MGVKKYQARNGIFWMVDEWLPLPNGQVARFRKRRFPRGSRRWRWWPRRERKRSRDGTSTVPRRRSSSSRPHQAYQPISKRDNDTWQSEEGRAKHLIRHLGQKLAAGLTVKDVDEYRTKRLAETTRRKKAPSPASLDCEVELLKRMLNYAVACGSLPSNPIAAAKLLRKPNVRRSVLDDGAFDKLHMAAEDHLKPIILVAYDTGMRLREVLGLRWSQVNLELGVIKLSAEDTKTEEPRTVFLTKRVREALDAQPRHIKSDWVFTNPETEEAWKDIRKAFRRACQAAKLTGVWFHDLRCSFVTNARRRGVPESVVMKMSGHRTRAVFDRYNIVEEDDLKDAVKRIEAAIAKSGRGQDQDKVGKG